MSIVDLDELVLQCRGINAKAYLQEAINCYRGAAYRSCIVATWIAVVFDVIDKLRELALSGDAEAQRVITDIDSWQPLVDRGDAVAIHKSLEFERNVIKLADEKFGFFEQNQTTDLERLRQDRNRCAHPTYQHHSVPYQPSAELARLHLRSAVDYLLSQPPVLGKAAVEQLVRLVSSAYFPRDTSRAFTALQQGGLLRPKDSLVTAFTDALLYGYFERAPDLKHRDETLVALDTTIRMFPGLAEARVHRAGPKICRKIGDEEVVWFFQLLRYVPLVWTTLQTDNRTRLDEYINRADPVTSVSAIAAALTITELRPGALVKILALTASNLGNLLTFTRDAVVIDRAVNLFCSVRSWVAANEVFDACIRPILGDLSDAHLQRILSAPRSEGADLVGSHGFSQFIDFLKQTGKVPTELQAFLKNWPHLA